MPPFSLQLQAFSIVQEEEYIFSSFSLWKQSGFLHIQSRNFTISYLLKNILHSVQTMYANTNAWCLLPLFFNDCMSFL